MNSTKVCRVLVVVIAFILQVYAVDTTTYWPKDDLSTLSMKDDGIESDGNFIMVDDVKLQLDSVHVLHDAISFVEAEYTPANVDAGGSVWRDFLAPTHNLPVDVEGIHVKFQLKNESSVLSEAEELKVMESVSLMLQHNFGAAMGPINYLFGKSSCTFTPILSKSLKYNTCYKSSKTETEIESFTWPRLFHSLSSTKSNLSPIQYAIDRVNPNPVKVYDSNEKFVDVVLRSSVLTFRNSVSDKQLLEIDISQTAITDCTVLQCHLSVKQKKFQSHSIIVTSVKDYQNVPILIPSKSKKLIVFQFPYKKTSSIGIKHQIIGTGFHQRIQLDVNISKTFPSEYANCIHDQTQTMKVLITQSLPATAYADLDELRRLERFNAFELTVISKHIEIERPSPISKQHVIALEYILPIQSSTENFVIRSISYPVHFRYQLPSNESLYRTATILAPVVSIYCKTTPSTVALQKSAVTQLESLEHNVKEALYETILSQSLLATEAEWKTIPLRKPLEALSVHIPVGNLLDQKFVTFLTLFVTVLSAVILTLSLRSIRVSNNAGKHN